ncbi:MULTISPECIES: SMI1/KNR4 family protein [unclassified Streptococcus]|uniref:SMI1/KNR4 family protein n=1 Tax=unclassified Streptococcus TaxID=2608887 RepID=UPI0010716D6D|nr:MULTISPECIES: SMI1/KNR4 family protein [unclassified Streptococcus]MBF0786845.1 SMI1/KNR4 family protein [Streptococcus sp. 19428wC2_LYSM12]MCQ9212748.1 SMI1/KNR4 family protein [Streptococcus sp. B01]MCQ9214089.1 SMI1/KNR4 family protein [Streptococcus sp. O1]TFV06215.1 SMI1/KNR4 family protein [Streptococcus sp. LYSM12]
MNNYEKAKLLIIENIDMMDYFGKCSNHIIELAERTLGVTYPKDYRDFIRNFGAGNFGSSEIYGVFREDFLNSGVPDSVWLTLLERKEIDFPKHLVIVYASGNGELFCFDYNQLNLNGEPTIVSFISSRNDYKYEVVYDNFGDFLLDIVTRELTIK